MHESFRFPHPTTHLALLYKYDFVSRKKESTHMQLIVIKNCGFRNSVKYGMFVEYESNLKERMEEAPIEYRLGFPMTRIDDSIRDNLCKETDCKFIEYMKIFHKTRTPFRLIGSPKCIVCRDSPGYHRLVITNKNRLHIKHI